MYIKTSAFEKDRILKYDLITIFAREERKMDLDIFHPFNIYQEEMMKPGFSCLWGSVISWNGKSWRIVKCFSALDKDTWCICRIHLMLSGCFPDCNLAKADLSEWSLAPQGQTQSVRRLRTIQRHTVPLWFIFLMANKAAINPQISKRITKAQQMSM